MKKRVITILMFILTTICTYSIKIVPFDFNYNLNLGAQRRVYEIENESEKTVTYDISIENIEGKSMAQWIELSTKKLDIKPKSTERLTVKIDAPIDLIRGEYMAKLILKEVPTSKNNSTMDRAKNFFFGFGKNKKIESSDENNLKIEVKKTYKINLYGEKGKLKRDIAISNTSKDEINKKIVGVIKNSGEKSTTIYVEVLNEKMIPLTAFQRKLLVNEEINLSNESIWNAEGVKLRVRETPYSKDSKIVDL